MNRLAAIALALVLAAPVAAEPLRILGPSSVPRDRLVRLEARGADPAAGLIWDVFPEVDAEESTGRLVFVAPPGVYTVKLRSVLQKDGKTSIETARATVTIGEPIPPIPVPPNPGPGPQPGPLPPAPITRAWVVVVEETGEAVGDRGRLLTDPGIRDYLHAKNWKTRVVDKDVVSKDGSTPADVRPWVEDAKGKTLPQLYLVGKDGAKVYGGACPRTAAELVKLIGGYAK
jgi:hypothetical protein